MCGIVGILDPTASTTAERLGALASEMASAVEHRGPDDGGVWVDASVVPVKPLSQWLGDALTEAGFFAFERPGPDRPISSWFLAATPRNLIFREWWKRSASVCKSARG